MGFRGLGLGLWVLLVGCGHASNTGNPDDPAPVTDVALEAGQCGVVREIRLEDPTDTFGATPRVARRADGFSLGPWDTSDFALSALVIDEAERRQHTFSAQGTRNDLHWASLLTDGSTAIEVYAGQPNVDGEESFGVRAWSDGASEPRDAGTLLHARWRGSDAVATTAALDGQSAAFAIWPIALSEPRAGLIGPDGAPLGASRSLTPNDDRFSSCQALTPTEHGALVSFVDRDADTLRLVELSASEDAPLDYSRPFASEQYGCPILALHEGGVSFLLPTSEDSPDYTLTHVERSGATSEESLSLKGRPLAFAQTPGGTLVLENRAGIYWAELLGAAGARSFELPDTLWLTSAVASESGRLFVDNKRDFEGPREIVEVACR